MVFSSSFMTYNLILNLTISANRVTVDFRRVLFFYNLLLVLSTSPVIIRFVHQLLVKWIVISNLPVMNSSSFVFPSGIPFFMRPFFLLEVQTNRN